MIWLIFPTKRISIKTKKKRIKTVQVRQATIQGLRIGWTTSNSIPGESMFGWKKLMNLLTESQGHWGLLAAVQVIPSLAQKWIVLVSVSNMETTAWPCRCQRTHTNGSHMVFFSTFPWFSITLRWSLGQCGKVNPRDQLKGWTWMDTSSQWTHHRGLKNVWKSLNTHQPYSAYGLKYANTDQNVSQFWLTSLLGQGTVEP